MVTYNSLKIIPDNNFNPTYEVRSSLMMKSRAVLLSPYSTPSCHSHNTTVTTVRDTSYSQFHLPAAIHLASHVAMTTHVIIIYTEAQVVPTSAQSDRNTHRVQKVGVILLLLFGVTLCCQGVQHYFNFIFQLLLAVATLTNKGQCLSI